MWNCCGGVPTSIVQEDQFPLLPSQIPLGSRVSGIGIDMLAVSVGECKVAFILLDQMARAAGQIPA